MNSKSSPKNVEQIDQKTSKKSTKKRTKNGPRGLPGASLGPPGAVPEAFLEDMQHNVKKHEKTQREKTGFDGILGPPRERKIDKNRVRGRSIRSRRPFLAVFSRFFRRRARKSTFAPARGPFWDPPTSRNCVINTLVSAHFRVFRKKPKKTKIPPGNSCFFGHSGKKGLPKFDGALREVFFGAFWVFLWGPKKRQI